jgi:single-strand DNA-binding protein
MNKVIISGRLTKDIELRYTQTQMPVTSFSLALDRGKDKDGNNKGADYPNCIAFGKTAETLQKWTSGKGARIMIEGRIQTGNYEKDGKKVYTTDVVVDRVEIIDFKAKNGGSVQQQFSAPEGFEAIDSDIPF